MHIKEISLENFRNYEKQNIILNPDINIIYGNNAQGKTNIIEAIFLCSYGKSFRAKKDSDLIKFGKERAKVEVLYEKIDREGKITVNIDNKKLFYINDINQKKISDIIGKINIVTFTPDDIEIIKDGPQRRRKFLDMMISSLKPNYIHLLNTYNKALEQRNNYLRQIKIENKSINMLDIWDETLSEYSYKIFEYRKYFIDKFSEKLEVFHNLITKSGKEEIKIKYISNGRDRESYLENLRKSRQVDIKRGFTATGIHRDDFMIYINNRPVAIFGSQGQQRTAVLTLKLCELQIVKDELNENPILLLDDFMSELDNQRRKSFLENIEGNQVIITCTDKIELNRKASNFFVEKGVCKRT
ncbi:MAG TPA: DNA replication/repair protein RecF [Candidatus Scatovivens faecipullorum]|nr:DNA replication/repair protein RecF [Candidatus Scatovivens faecipullorum]